MGVSAWRLILGCVLCQRGLIALNSDRGESLCHPAEQAFHYGDITLCHSLTPVLPFRHGLAVCRRSGGRLVTVLNDEHNRFLYRLLNQSTFIGAVERQRLLRHPQRDENAYPGVIWSWLSGQPAEYVNMLEKETPGFYRQPDGGGFEGCIELMKHPVLKIDEGNGKWGDADCRAPKPALCMRRVKTSSSSASSSSRATLPRPPLQHAAVDSSPRGTCVSQNFSRLGIWRLGERLSEQRGRSVCLSKLQTARNYTSALRQCQRLNHGSTVWRAGWPARPRRRSEVPQLRADLPTHTTTVWAGADRRNAHLQWRWQHDGTPLERAAWAAGEPREAAGFDCAAYNWARSGLVASACGCRLATLCETPPRGCLAGYHLDDGGYNCYRDSLLNCHRERDVFKGEKSVADGNGKAFCRMEVCHATCPKGMTQLGATCFVVHEAAGMTHSEAVQFCTKEKNMHELMVKTTEENEFVRRQVVRLGRPAWVNVDDSFSNFHRYVPYGLPDEPNEGPGSCSIVWFDGEWMDVDCEDKFTVICTWRLHRSDCVQAAKSL